MSEEFERLDSLTAAVEDFGAAMVSAWELVYCNIYSAVDSFRLVITRAFIADEWHLGRLAWYLPDWIVRLVPVRWVAHWLSVRTNVEE